MSKCVYHDAILIHCTEPAELNSLLCLLHENMIKENLKPRPRLLAPDNQEVIEQAAQIADDWFTGPGERSDEEACSPGDAIRRALLKKGDGEK